MLLGAPDGSPAPGGSAGSASRDRTSSGRATGGHRPADLRVLIDFKLEAVSGFTKELLDRKAVRPSRLHGCPAREPFYLMVGHDNNDRILACSTGRKPGSDNRIAVQDFVGLNEHLLRRRTGSSKWELVLTTGSIIPIHDAIRGDVGPGDDYRKMGYIVLNRAWTSPPAGHPGHGLNQALLDLQHHPAWEQRGPPRPELPTRKTLGQHHLRPYDGKRPYHAEQGRFLRVPGTLP